VPHSLIREVGGSEADRISTGRAPLRRLFYEIEDVTKDILLRFEDQERFAQRMRLWS